MSKLSEARRHVLGMGMAEAQEELRNLRRQLFFLRLQHQRGEVRNNRQFQQTKKDIARLMFRIGELNREEAYGYDETEELAAPETGGALPAAPAAPELPSGESEGE